MGNSFSSDKSKRSQDNVLKKTQIEIEMFRKESTQRLAIPQRLPYTEETTKGRNYCSELRFNSSEGSNAKPASDLISKPLRSVHPNFGCSRENPSTSGLPLNFGSSKIPLIPVPSALNDTKINAPPSLSSLAPGLNNTKVNIPYLIPSCSSNSGIIKEKKNVINPEGNLGHIKKNLLSPRISDFVHCKANLPTSVNCSIKKTYHSKEEFNKIFENFIKLEEIEEQKEAKVIYKNEFRILFINEQLFTTLIDYLSLLNDSKSLKLLHNSMKQIKMRDNPRRLAIFNDYHKKITPKNLKNVVVSDENGEDLKVNVLFVFNMHFFIFNENVSEEIIKFNISFKASESFDGIKRAMEKYLKYNGDPVVNSIFLGQKTEAKLDFDIQIKDYSANGLFKLNESQIKALKNALMFKVSIIQGPPGTGKTQTISSIVYHLDNLCRKNDGTYTYSNKDTYCYNNKGSQRFETYFKATSKILICAASNSPVFDLRQKLAAKGLRVLQVLACSKEDEHKEDSGTLKYHFDRKSQKDLKLQQLIKKYESIKEKNREDPPAKKLEQIIYQMSLKIKVSIIKRYDIICCTTRILPNRIFKGISFDFAIVDEATQCIEPDIVLCLLKDVKHLVLVGDVNQLGPVIKSQLANDLGFDVPTIERLQDLGVPLAFLDTQYRMQPFLSKFSSKNFYEGKLKDGNLSPSPLKFPKTIKTHGFFYHIHSKEEKSLGSSSILNTKEAEAVLEVVKYLKKKNIENKNIGIITFYGGQREHLKGLIMKNRFEDIEIMSVDESQGREKEYIILSCVRSNAFKSVGFLDEPRRLNVAMTRVKNGLVVCGNANTFVKSELWSQLVSYFQVNNAIFTGRLENLKLHSVQLGAIKPYAIKRKNKYSTQSEYQFIDYPYNDDFGE